MTAIETMHLFSDRVIYCAESDKESDTYRAKFVICDFGENENHVALNRDTIEGWMGTLVNKPLVGKIAATARGRVDFTGHNKKIVKRVDEHGRVCQDVTFDTAAFGTFTGVGIEKVDGTECIVASCEIWKRFENACALIMERIKAGALHTSWEISVLKSHADTRGQNRVKVIDDGIFTAHCLLGEAVLPAYESSRLLEVAEAEPCFEDELAEALQQDMGTLTHILKEKEDRPLKVITEESACGELQTAEADGKSTSAAQQTNVENAEKAPKADGGEKDSQDAESRPDGEATGEAESASLTDHDLFAKLQRAVFDALGESYIAFHFPVERTIWVKQSHPPLAELEYVLLTYTIVDDEVVLGEPQKATLALRVQDMNTRLDELNNAIAAANEEIRQKDQQIAELNRQIAELAVFRNQVEQAEQERVAREQAEKMEALRRYAVDSGFIAAAEVADGGSLAALILENDEAGIKSVIADRFMESMKRRPKGNARETAQAEYKKPEVKAGLINAPYADDVREIMDSYLHKK